LKNPEGEDGWTELAQGGINAVRSFDPVDNATTSAARDLKKYIKFAFAHKVYVCPFLRKLAVQNSSDSASNLRGFVSQFTTSSGILFWKLTDEPAWGKISPVKLKNSYSEIKSADPNHLVWITHAPRGTFDQLLPYSAACDALATDIYPVSEPPGKHSNGLNKGLSMVGDFASQTVALAGANRLPFMILQACWSGVIPSHNPKNRLMFPTYREERYMLYEAIINGSNSVFFFGLTAGLTPSEKASGLNWAFWRAVLKPLLNEIKPGSEIYPALIAPDSTYPLAYTASPQLEVRSKELGPYLYIFAAAREGAKIKATFSGLEKGEVTVLEENRTISASEGQFSDSFQPHDVHVYRALRKIRKDEFVATHLTKKELVAVPGDDESSETNTQP
jgi:hypothetical protein